MDVPDPMTAPRLLLASGSPRRRELLGQIGVPHAVSPAEVDESRAPGESAQRYVLRLARLKAGVVYERGARDDAALAADTTVVLGKQIYGKPENRDDCTRMLLALSGRTHRVLTAVALAYAGGLDSELSVSEVTFAKLTREDCERYWATGEPRDKAGGYAVQGLGALFIRHLSGSYSGVMGLPLYETAQLLARAGIGHALSGAP